MPDRMAWRRMVGSAINDTVGGYQRRGSARQDGEAVPDRMAWRRMVGSGHSWGLPEVGEAVPDRMAWRRMVGSAINDTVGGYQK